MSQERICPNGHTWNAAEAEKCPVCGTPAETGTVDGAGRATFASFRTDVNSATHRRAAADPSASPEGLPQIPGFELLAELGRGGMGVVYKAWQLSLGRVVALKMLLAGPHAEPALLARFRREAEAVARLQHPNIVQIHEVGQADGRPYLVLEYIGGGSLAARLRGMPQPPHEAAKLIEILARAVQHAHRHGIIHRDLKPANVLLKDEGGRMKDEAEPDADSSFIFHPSSFHLKIADFGLARITESSDQATKTGEVMGTPSYMAPEQASGIIKQVTPAADIYALGAILYELLTGRPPFRADSAMATMMQVLTDDPVSPAWLRPGLSRDLETICMKCLEKMPRKRYAGAEALADDLHRFLNNEPIQARPVGRLTRLAKWAKRRPALAALVTVGMLVTLAVVAGSLWYSHDVEQRNTRLQAAVKLADQRFQKARQAVKDMLSRVGDESLVNVPQMDIVRRDLLEKALGYCLGFLEEDSEDPDVRREVGQAAYDVGDIRRELGQNEEAAKAYRQAVDVLTRLHAEYPRRPEFTAELATSLNKLGVMLDTVGDRLGAKAAYRQGLDLLAGLIEQAPETPQYRFDQARLYVNLATVLALTRGQGDAELVYQKAIEGYQRLIAAYPDVDDYPKGLAGAYNNLSRLVRKKEPERAAEYLGKAHDLLQVLVQDHHDVRGYRENLAITCGNLGNDYWALGRLPEAEGIYQEGLELARKLVKDFPDVPRYRAELAVAWESLGLQHYLVQRRQFRTAAMRVTGLGATGVIGPVPVAMAVATERERAVEALAPCAESLRIKTELVRQYPNAPDFESSLGLSLQHRAAQYRDWGFLPEAAAVFRRAAEHQRRALELSPRDVRYRRMVRDHLWYLAETLVLMGHHAESAEQCDVIPTLLENDAEGYFGASGILVECALAAVRDATLSNTECKALARKYLLQAEADLKEAIDKGYEDPSEAKARAQQIQELLKIAG